MADTGPYRAEFGAVHHEDVTGFLFQVEPPKLAENVVAQLNLGLAVRKALGDVSALCPPPDVKTDKGVMQFHDPNAAQHLLRIRDIVNAALKPDA